MYKWERKETRNEPQHRSSGDLSCPGRTWEDQPGKSSREESPDRQ